MAQEEFDTALELEHEDLIKEELEDDTSKLKSEKDLPKAIRDKIAGIKMRVGSYKKKPTEKEKEIIEKKSVDIADDIQDWLEETPEAAATPAAEEKEEKEEEATPAAEKEEKEEKEEKDDPAEKAKAEKAILEVLKAGNGIYAHELKKLLKADSVDAIPDKLKIGNTILETNGLGFYFKVEK